MGNKILMELISISAVDNDCTVWHESAIVFSDSLGNKKAIPWHRISSGDFTLQHPLPIVCIEGYDRYNPAIYCGFDDNNYAVFVIYKRIP